jgi:hypothetical protein
LKKVTEMAYDQIQLLGMNEKVGMVSFPKADDNNKFAEKPYSQKTAQLIDSVSSTGARILRGFSDTSLGGGICRNLQPLCLFSVTFARSARVKYCLENVRLNSRHCAR